ncbi:LOW QUALITY PROTEIN: hypothetical protein Cgig2_023776 [Carnegiea gigantea]|uniref:Uncharacterized protein n=1 Tax=Carnegiea gigantea TaxID=171969 RepID=A0A9Q1Q5U0_9CARY|nr:LOW QUALITY PROTEIN: hypothetical protein Cgig2_023776 [Carnegiea gigantea]
MPHNSYPPEILGPVSLRPCVNTLRFQYGPVGSLVPWSGPPFLLPRPPQPRPLQAAHLADSASPSFQLPGHLDQPSAFPNVVGAESPSNLRHSTAALSPQVNASAITTSSSMTFRGSEVPRAIKVRLDEVGGWPLSAQGGIAGSWRTNTHGLSRGGLFLETKGAIPN